MRERGEEVKWKVEVEAFSHLVCGRGVVIFLFINIMARLPFWGVKQTHPRESPSMRPQTEGQKPTRRKLLGPPAGKVVRTVDVSATENKAEVACESINRKDENVGAANDGPSDKKSRLQRKKWGVLSGGTNFLGLRREGPRKAARGRGRMLEGPPLDVICGVARRMVAVPAPGVGIKGSLEGGEGVERSRERVYPTRRMGGRVLCLSKALTGKGRGNENTCSGFTQP